MQGPRHGFWVAARRAALTALAVMLIVIGLVTFPLPIPVGAVLIVLGFGLLISASTAVTVWLRRQRSRYPFLNKEFLWVEERLPSRIQQWLRKTDP